MIDKARPTLIVGTGTPKGLRNAGQTARSDPKIAIVHEWLTTYAGSEKVLEAMLDEFPEADLFCLIDFLAPGDRAKLQNRRPKTTFLQKLPMVKKHYPFFLALMPFAVEQHDLSGYDIVVSNSHAVAKGVIVGPDQLHICYCYSPMRYAWDLQNQYLHESGIRGGFRALLSRLVLHYIRLWDVRTASSVDHFIACSGYIARRVRRVYRRDADVIYPNVAVEQFTPGETRGDFYLASSRLTPYKRVLLIVEAFALMPTRKLVVIGTGPQYDRIRKAATPNVTVLGYQHHPVLLAHMQTAKAFIFAAEEDFGIAPLEAQACGTPVLAFGRGGASETVVDGVTGLHFHTQDSAAVCDAVERFEALREPFDPQVIRAHAQRFSTQRFRREFRDYVQRAWADHWAAEDGRSTGPAKSVVAQSL